MADALTGCTVLNAVWTVPDNMLDEFMALADAHRQYMEAKSHQHGENELINFFWASGSIYEDQIDMDSPTKEGQRFIFIEVYRNEAGLRHHWSESTDFNPILEDMIGRGLLVEFHNNLKVLNSLWD